MPLDRAINCNKTAYIQCKEKDIISSKCEIGRHLQGTYMQGWLPPPNSTPACITTPHTYLAVQNHFAQGAAVPGAGHAPHGPRDHCMSALRGTQHGSCIYHRATTRRGQAGAVGKIGTERTGNSENTQCFGLYIRRV